MKTDLTTAIGVAIVGALIAFFVTNLLFGEIQEYSFKAVSGEIDTTLVSPDPEVFNYRALNPTVEVYVGDCTQTDSDGQCIDQIDENDADGIKNIVGPSSDTENQGAE